MSTTTASINIQMSASEELTTAEQPNATSAAERTLKCNALNYNASLSANSTPKVDISPIYRRCATGATALFTIDLTAAPGLKSPDSVTRSIDLTGKKLKHLMIKAGSANNAAGYLIAPGSANPYPLFGTAKSILLLPGEEIALACGAGVESQKAAVAAGVKNIDLTPGGTGDILEIAMAFGT